MVGHRVRVIQETLTSDFGVGILFSSIDPVRLVTWGEANGTTCG